MTAIDLFKVTGKNAMRSYVIALLLGLLPSLSHAEIVEQDVRGGVAASADYAAGDRDKPAVLVLHGFLQTREFATVVAVTRGLRDAGYTTLAPTLSLGIPHRQQSLSCEAVHRHRMEDDVEEIGRWVKWLKARGHTSIVLLGHSFGSLQLLAYLHGKPDPAVKAYLGTSLVEAQVGKTDRGALIGDLEDRAQRGKRALVTYPLSFCNKYVATPESLLSYARWDQPRTLAAMKRMPVKSTLVMGDSDSMLGPGWLRALGHIQVPIVVVKGANHFMDGMHEFDLLEHATAFLDTVKAAP